MTQHSVRAGGVDARFDVSARVGIVRLMKVSALALVLLMAPIPVLAAPASQITGENVVYKLSLSKLHTYAITGATGRVHLQIVDGCSGWASMQSMTLIIRGADGSLAKTINNFTTWESKNGRLFTFTISTADGGGKPRIVTSGTATRSSEYGAGVIKYSVPANKEVAFPAGTLFPIQHTEALLNAAQAGKKFISPLLFDGTSTDGAESSFITILGHQGPQNTPWPALNGYGSTMVNSAFFPRTNADSTPEFRTAMRYFDNGVATGLMLDFGGFVMSGKLVSLQLPKSACPAAR